MHQVISSEEMTQYTSKGKKQHHFWTLIPPSSFTGPLPGQSQKPTLPASLAPYQANLKSQYCQIHLAVHCWSFFSSNRSRSVRKGNTFLGIGTSGPFHSPLCFFSVIFAAKLPPYPPGSLQELWRNIRFDIVYSFVCW